MSIYSDIILRDNPIAYFRFEETSGNSASDSSGNNHTGTRNANASFGALGPLIGGDFAATFPAGSNDYISFPNTLPWSSAVSFEAWINLSTLLTGTTAIIYTDNRCIFRINSPAEGGGLAMFIGEAGGFEPRGQQTGAFPLTSWRYVVGTWDGINIRIYIDSILSTTTARGGTPLAASGSGLIGANGGPNNFKLLDELAIYDYRLNQQKISAHFAAADTTEFKLTNYTYSRDGGRILTRDGVGITSARNGGIISSRDGIGVFKTR